MTDHDTPDCEELQLTPKRFDDVMDLLGELHYKYWHLVWYARKNVDHPHPASVPGIKQVQEDHPVDVFKLHVGSFEWIDGFNSGMLAALNLVHTAFTDFTAVDQERAAEEGVPIDSIERINAIEEAKAEFPMLDT